MSFRGVTGAQAVEVGLDVDLANADTSGAEAFHEGQDLLGPPGLGECAAVGDEPPGDVLPEAPGFGGVGEALPLRGIVKREPYSDVVGEGDALEEAALCSFGWEVGDGQAPIGADDRADASDIGADGAHAAGTGDRNAVVPIGDEVEVVEPDEAYGWEVALGVCQCFPAVTQMLVEGSEVAVEVAGPGNSADDRIDWDVLASEVDLSGVAERGQSLVQGEDVEILRVSTRQKLAELVEV